MAGRNRDMGNNVSRNRRRRGITAGGFLAAAAAGSIVGASPADADVLDSILDPILQPLVTSLTDSLSSIDPAAVADLTSLIDMSGLSLSTVDPAAALAAAADPAAAVAAAVDPANATIPLTVLEGTEPAVNVSVDGATSVPMLVDTGSSGLVIPYTDLGSNFFTQLESLFQLGFPTSIGESGYSGGVDYVYLTYDTTVDYGGVVTTTSTPVDVEILSWPTSFSSPLDFQQFLSDNQVNGILGIGSTDAGPGTSPIQAAGYSGVLVDVPKDELILGTNTAATANELTVSGAPLSNLEVGINNGTPVSVSGDIDSGGVYGTIPSNLVGGASTVPPGTLIQVYDSSGTELYQYTTTAADAPTVVSSGSTMDTGYIPFSQAPIYLDYSPSPNGTTTFDLPAPVS